MDRSTGKHTPSSTEELFQEITEDLNIRWNCPNYVGSMDGTHIRIKCLPKSSNQYFNYEQYHSIVLQAVVDANLNL
jgi:hypothetical protein